MQITYNNLYSVSFLNKEPLVYLTNIINMNSDADTLIFNINFFDGI